MIRNLKVYKPHTKKLESDSIFSIIGRSEVDLTKSMAALFYHDEVFLKVFLFMIDKKLYNMNFGYRIYAEQLPNGGNKKIRRDLAINIESKNAQTLIVIEAKNLFLKNRKSLKIADQLKTYFDPDLYNDVHTATRKIAVTLTRDRIYTVKKRDYYNEFISLTWEDIYKEMGNWEFNNPITSYLQTELKRANFMKTYDREIFSPPSGTTIKKIRKLNIYCCPADRNLQNAIYLLPRIPVNSNHKLLKEIIEELSMKPIDNFKEIRGKGFAVALYPIKNTLIVDPNATESIENETLRNNVIEWMSDKKEKLKVYELGSPMYFKQPYFTKGKNNSFQGYYDLSDIWSGSIPSKKEEKNKYNNDL